jgi:hypothetical protein
MDNARMRSVAAPPFLPASSATRGRRPAPGRRTWCPGRSATAHPALVRPGDTLRPDRAASSSATHRPKMLARSTADAGARVQGLIFKVVVGGLLTAGTALSW